MAHGEPPSDFCTALSCDDMGSVEMSQFFVLETLRFTVYSVDYNDLAK